jgi:replicative DNA helicase
MTEKNYLDKFLETIELNNRTKVISTGFTALDGKLNGGLYPGLYTIGAISSLGKTALALNIADNIAFGGDKVLFFSLEMPRDELLSRSLSRMVFRINPESCREEGTNRVLYGKTKKNHEDIFFTAVNDYREKIFPNLKILECPFSTDRKHIIDMVYKYIEKTGEKPVVFVDYLQIINICKEDMTEKRGIDNIVKALKQLSRDLNLIIFVVSSFNRESYNSQVTFNAFKESGGIEYTSDFVFGLQLSILDDKNDDRPNIGLINKIKEAKKGDKNGIREVSLVVLKNRNGISGVTQKFNFYGKNNIFEEELEPDYKKELKTVKETNNLLLLADAKTKEKVREKVLNDLKSKKQRDEVIQEIDKREVIEKELQDLRAKQKVREAKEEAKRLFEKEQQEEAKYDI